MPNLYEWILFAALSIYAIFMTEMYGHEKKTFEAFRAATVAAGAAQEAKTKETIKRQEKAAQETSDDYKKRIAAIRSTYGYGVQQRPSGRVMPTATEAAEGVDARPSYGVLAEQCAETTQQLISLQSFIKSTEE